MAKKAAETKGEPAGRTKGTILDQALEALGKEAPAQAVAQKMKELATEQGYNWTPSAEYVAEKLTARSKKDTPPPPPTPGNGEPTMTDLLEVKKLLDQEGLEEVVKMVGQVDDLERAAGGRDKFRACLTFWKNAAGKG